MPNCQLKFIFLKTPQIKHRFSTGKNQVIYPVIRHEVYHAKLVGDIYEFFGHSYSGVINVDNFNVAIRGGFVSFVL
jgi:hypothetical protein